MIKLMSVRFGQLRLPERFHVELTPTEAGYKTISATDLEAQVGQISQTQKARIHVAYEQVLRTATFFPEGSVKAQSNMPPHLRANIHVVPIPVPKDRAMPITDAYMQPDDLASQQPNPAREMAQFLHQWGLQYSVQKEH